MPELFIKPTVFKVGCPTYRCRNVAAYEVGIERGPSNLNQSFCRECLVQIIRKSPTDVITEALGDIKVDDSSAQKIAELEAKIAELEGLLEDSTKPVEPIQEEKPEPKPEPKPIEGCKACELQFTKKTEEPCKTCKESNSKGEGFINFKAREKKQEG